MKTSGAVQAPSGRKRAGWKISFAPLEFGRYAVLKSFYELISFLMSLDYIWHDPLCSSFKAKPRSRILVVGKNPVFAARFIARRHPEAAIVVATSGFVTVKRIALRLLRNTPSNLTLMRTFPDGLRSVRRSGFDHVVAVFAFGQRRTEQKRELSGELIHVLSDGGWLHVAEYDRPLQPGDKKLLSLVNYLYGSEATASHLDGRWTECLNSAGFSRIRTRLSISLSGARIAILTARKR